VVAQNIYRKRHKLLLQVEKQNAFMSKEIRVIIENTGPIIYQSEAPGCPHLYVGCLLEGFQKANTS
jgi:hypothetical protein